MNDCLPPVPSVQRAAPELLLSYYVVVTPVSSFPELESARPFHRPEVFPSHSPTPPVPPLPSRSTSGVLLFSPPHLQNPALNCTTFVKLLTRGAPALLSDIEPVRPELCMGKPRKTDTSGTTLQGNKSQSLHPKMTLRTPEDDRLQGLFY